MKKIINSERYATQEQTETIISNSDERTGLAVALMFYHGLRISDVVDLELSNFSESEKGTVLDFTDKKTKQHHTYILVDRVVPLLKKYLQFQRKEIIAGWMQDKMSYSEYLFISSKGQLTQQSLQETIVTICNDLGFFYLLPHSFRHGFVLGR